MTSVGDLRAAQLAAVVTTLAERPGLSTYVLRMHVPVPQPDSAEQARTGLLATFAPLPLVLDLLSAGLPHQCSLTHRWKEQATPRDQ